MGCSIYCYVHQSGKSFSKEESASQKKITSRRHSIQYSFIVVALESRMLTLIPNEVVYDEG